MKLVIQRVIHARLTVDGVLKGAIDRGMVVFVGFGKNDHESLIEPAVRKVLKLRIFADVHDKMNLSLLDISGGLMVVSQFTLYARTEGGNRPDFLEAMNPSEAETLFNRFVETCMKFYPGKIVGGDFGSQMLVEIHNDGPVTIVINWEK
ncbi:MAG TPA: D-aminoacyl-tRNA deacylase [bacterium]|nr:D-aminoacyl-tRNA deacylase [bacterium]HOL49599.1 D-aminoacyl-tRNA deacylase [bacterium]HPO52313.1 D-aminoacyl-tRNA deacylase [bacterium]